MWWLLMGLALAGGKYKNLDSDVIVERDIAKAQEALFTTVQDFPTMSKVFPADCAEEWGFGVPSAGLGGTTVVTYHLGAWKRRLTATVSKATPSYHVEWDHAGKKGFITQWVFSEGPDGTTHVKLGTYVKAPPWPFRPAYFNKIRPMWQDCHDRTLIELAK